MIGNVELQPAPELPTPKQKEKDDCLKKDLDKKVIVKIMYGEKLY